MALLGSSWPILVKNCPQSLVQKGFQNWPKMGPKVRSYGFRKKRKQKKKWMTSASFLEQFWEPFWGPFWDQIGQRGGKMSSREPSGASKSQKAAFSKTLKNMHFLKVFGVQRPPKRASRGPRRLPRGTQRAPKHPKKGSKNGPQN